jgi:hypothetical protein
MQAGVLMHSVVTGAWPPPASSPDHVYGLRAASAGPLKL